MLNVNEILSVIIGLALGVGVTVSVLFPVLRKKGINTDNILKGAGAEIKAVEKYTDAAKAIVPENKFLNILSILEHYGEIAVGQAQQLNISSQLPADQKKKSAEEYEYNILKTIGINVDDNVKTIVKGIIENKVYELKSPEEKNAAQQTAAQNQISQFQTQNLQLQNERNQLQQENQQLKQKIATVQNTVATAQAPTQAQDILNPIQNAVASTKAAQ